MVCGNTSLSEQALNLNSNTFPHCLIDLIALRAADSSYDSKSNQYDHLVLALQNRQLLPLYQQRR